MHCRLGGVKVLDEDGVLWQVSESGGWQQDTEIPGLPCPWSEIKFMESTGQECSLVTMSNQVWIWDGHGSWVDCGTWPGDTVVKSASWGRIKARYDEP
jgi:hypothetical protein